MATTFSSSLFSYSKQLNLLVADVSTLEPVGQVWSRLAQSGAQGFIIASEKTGKLATWFVDRVDVTEGEIQGWNLKPTPETIMELPQLRGERLLVVNT